MTPTDSLKAALEPDETGFSDADCVAQLLDGYARDMKRKRLAATSQALERAAWLIRSMSAALRASTDAAPVADAEGLARRFHETYERLAPSFGYETRPDTKAFDPLSPNGKLMIAVCNEITHPPVPDAAGDVMTLKDVEADTIALMEAASERQGLSVNEWVASRLREIAERALAQPPAAEPVGMREALAVREFADRVMDAATNCCIDPDAGPDCSTSVSFTGEEGAQIANALHKIASLATGNGGEGRSLTIPVLNPIYAEDHPLLAPIIEKRARAAGNFSPEFSGQRGADFDRGLLCAFEAVNGELQRMTDALASKPGGEGGDGE